MDGLYEVWGSGVPKLGRRARSLRRRRRLVVQTEVGHGYHAPNESYDWTQAAGGMAAFARYIERT